MRVSRIVAAATTQRQCLFEEIWYIVTPGRPCLLLAFSFLLSCCSLAISCLLLPPLLLFLGPLLPSPSSSPPSPPPPFLFSISHIHMYSLLSLFPILSHPAIFPSPSLLFPPSNFSPWIPSLFSPPSPSLSLSSPPPSPLRVSHVYKRTMTTNARQELNGSHNMLVPLTPQPPNPGLSQTT